MAADKFPGFKNSQSASQYFLPAVEKIDGLLHASVVVLCLLSRID